MSSTLAHTETNTEYRFPDEAERLEELGIHNMREFLETLERYNIDARYEKTGEMYVALDLESAERLLAQYQEAKANGDDVVWFDKDAVREQVNSPTLLAGMWDRTGQDGVIDPARLCWGLKDVLVSQLGVRIFEGTKLLDVEPVGEEAMRASCEGGVIHSNKVLLATNAYTSTIGSAVQTAQSWSAAANPARGDHAGDKVGTRLDATQARSPSLRLAPAA